MDVMVFKQLSKIISVISWRTIIFVEETGILGETPEHPQATEKLDTT